MQVHVVRIDHKHDTETYICEDEEAAKRVLLIWALEHWGNIVQLPNFHGDEEREWDAAVAAGETFPLLPDTIDEIIEAYFAYHEDHEWREVYEDTVLDVTAAEFTANPNVAERLRRILEAHEKEGASGQDGTTA